MTALSTGIVSAVAHQPAHLRNSVLGAISIVSMDVTAQMVSASWKKPSLRSLWLVPCDQSHALASSLGMLGLLQIFSPCRIWSLKWLQGMDALL